MKKLIYIIAAVLTISFANQVQAQVITLTANLNTTLALKMDKSGVTFDFTTLNEYKEGLGGYENASHASTSNVSSTANWKLSFKAQSEMTHKDGDAVMPLDNVGLSAKFTGANKIKNNAEKVPLALSTKETVILDHNGKNSNAGDTDVNSFTIYWEMGTQNKNQASILLKILRKDRIQLKLSLSQQKYCKKIRVKNT
jgi:hypothetical protein